MSWYFAVLKISMMALSRCFGLAVSARQAWSGAIKAKAGGADLDKAAATAVGWEKLAASVAEAERVARPDKADRPALAARGWPVLHRLGPVFLDTLKLHAVLAATTTLRAVELLRAAYGCQ